MGHGRCNVRLDKVININFLFIINPKCVAIKIKAAELYWSGLCKITNANNFQLGTLLL